MSYSNIAEWSPKNFRKIIPADVKSNKNKNK